MKSNKWFYRSMFAGALAVIFGSLSMFGHSVFGNNPRENPGDAGSVSPTFQNLDANAADIGLLNVSRVNSSFDSEDISIETRDNNRDGVFGRLMMEVGDIELSRKDEGDTMHIGHLTTFDDELTVRGDATFRNDVRFTDDVQIDGNLDYNWNINVTSLTRDTNALGSYSHIVACPDGQQLLSCQMTFVTGQNRVLGAGTMPFNRSCIGSYRHNVAGQVRALVSATCLDS